MLRFVLDVENLSSRKMERRKQSRLRLRESVFINHVFHARFDNFVKIKVIRCFRIAKSCSLIQTQGGPSTLMEILFAKNAHNDDEKMQLSQNDCIESHHR